MENVLIVELQALTFVDGINMKLSTEVMAVTQLMRTIACSCALHAIRLAIIFMRSKEGI